jgi:hypothetical protein
VEARLGFCLGGFGEGKPWGSSPVGVGASFGAGGEGQSAP